LLHNLDIAEREREGEGESALEIYRGGGEIYAK